MELYGVPKNSLFLERIPRFPMTTDQKVKGSSPFGCTKKSLNMMNIQAFFVLAHQKYPMTPRIVVCTCMYFQSHTLQLMNN